MADLTSEILSDVTSAQDPSFVVRGEFDVGGVDPLGLRLINFQLMDLLMPGLNNVARHIRPFTVVTWAWRRAAQLAKARDLAAVEPDLLLNFVDRVEIVYAWSQFLHSPDADLPGRTVLMPLLAHESYEFSGDAWLQRRQDRARSTALSAPINYGPALKSLGWVIPHKNVFSAADTTTPALDAFEADLGDLINHPVFSSFDPQEVQRQDVAQWAERWSLAHPTAAEADFVQQAFLGTTATPERRGGARLVQYAIMNGAAPDDIIDIRRQMYATHFTENVGELPASVIWLSIQMRQAFRLALEALFHWTIYRVSERNLQTSELAEILAGPLSGITTSDWLSGPIESPDPVGLLEQLNSALDSKNFEADIPRAIVETLRVCLRYPAIDVGILEAHDRLPLARAQREVAHWAEKPATVFFGHVFESWILGQHMHWAIGRGLATARANGNQLMRLRLRLDDDGWAPIPGARAGRPEATPDRLGTIVSLLRQAGAI